MVRMILDLDEFETAIKEASGLVAVDFTATWCGPCRQIGPKFEAMSTEADFQNVVFLKVDVDEGAEIAQKYKITCMPTFLFFKGGKKVDEFSGANDGKLKEKLMTNK